MPRAIKKKRYFTDWKIRRNGKNKDKIKYNSQELFMGHLGHVEKKKKKKKNNKIF